MDKQQVLNILKSIAYNLQSKHYWLKGKLSLLLAQIIIESNWLKSTHQGNCLGIKVPKSKIDIWKNKQLLWTHEWINGKYVKVQCWFMTYPSIEACIESGYIKTLSYARYKETRESIDWWDATNLIRINGYATSPVYTNTLRNLILKQKLYTVDWSYDYNEPIFDNFIWGETFSNVQFKGKRYYRIIEPPEIYLPNTVDLVRELQLGRNYIGKPFVVNSWYRIGDYNSYIGGVPNSQHRLSNASDIRTPKGLTSYQFYKIMEEKTDCTGYGIGRRYCHFDRKANVKKRIWYY